MTQKGIVLGTQQQQTDLNIEAIHQKPHTKSTLLMKNVLTDKSKVLYRGTIKIEKNAFQSQGVQRADTLLLSPEAHCDAVPILDVENDEVIGKASKKDVYEKLLTHRIVHVIVFNDKREMALQLQSKYKSFCPQHWSSAAGGHVQSGESYEQAVIREVKEETNMKVLHQELIGYQDIYESNRVIRQTRSFCIVESIGDFVIDPDGDVTEIKLIDPRDYKKYFDWGEIGEKIMKKAVELNNKYKIS